MSQSKALEARFPDSLADLISRDTGPNAPDLDLFHSAVDDSDYSLDDWVEALLDFDKWLSSQKITKRPLNIMIGYINCCVMGNATNISSPSLNIVVYQSLTEYGFDAGNLSQI